MSIRFNRGEQAQRILALLKTGMDQSDAARKVGVSRQYVSQLMTPLKAMARHQLRTEIKVGRIRVPSFCVECRAETRLHGHHDDYTRPLDVRWLCSTCHGKAHARQQIPGKGGSGVISEWMARLARRKARKMTQAQRTALALKMNAARWAAKGAAAK